MNLTFVSVTNCRNLVYWKIFCTQLAIFQFRNNILRHYNDVIISAMASQITAVSIVNTAICSGADQRKYKSTAALAFVWEIHRWSLNSPQKKAINAENVSIWWRDHDGHHFAVICKKIWKCITGTEFILFYFCCFRCLVQSSDMTPVVYVPMFLNIFPITPVPLN